MEDNAHTTAAFDTERTPKDRLRMGPSLLLHVEVDRLWKVEEDRR